MIRSARAYRKTRLYFTFAPYFEFRIELEMAILILDLSETVIPERAGR